MTAIDGSGNASFATATLTIGMHTLSAHFIATTSLAASTSAGDSVTITGIQTAATLTAAPNPSYLSQPVTLLAIVASAAPSQTLTGTVRFFDGNTALGDVLLDARGAATLSVSTFAVGTHAIQASYLGSGPFVLSQSNVVQQVVLNSMFTLAVTPTEITLPTQHHTTFRPEVTSIGLFSGIVTLGCGAVPAHATCRITPQAVSLTSPGSTEGASVYLDTSLAATGQNLFCSSLSADAHRLRAGGRAEAPFEDRTFRFLRYHLLRPDLRLDRL